MNAQKNNRVRMVRGKELRISRERISTFWAWQREDGTFVQTNTCRRILWNEKGIAFVKVTSVMTTFKDVIPGTSDERELIEQTLVGSHEHCDKYLYPTVNSLKVEYVDDGVLTEWTF